MDSFGSILKKTRKESEFKTLENLAVAVGVSRQSLGHYETGIRFPDTETLRKITLTLGVSSDYLLGLTDVKSADTSTRSICEATGLTEKAVDILHECKVLYEADRQFMSVISLINALIEETKEQEDSLLTCVRMHRLELSLLENNLSKLRATPSNKDPLQRNLLESIQKEEKERVLSIQLGGIYWLCQEKFTSFLKKYAKFSPKEVEFQMHFLEVSENNQDVPMDENLIDELCADPVVANLIKSYYFKKEDTDNGKK